MEAKTRFTVDAVHCQRAADELYDMLWQQEREFLERYYSLGLVKKVPRVLSVLGLLHRWRSIRTCGGDGLRHGRSRYL
jgi:hypothetical protein